MTLTKRMALLGLGALTLAGIGSFVHARADRLDCPGTIECPITGELVCRDECPAVDPNREDCPGRIECPQSGELVCVDLCPAGGTSDAPRPRCCRESN